MNCLFQIAGLLLFCLVGTSCSITYGNKEIIDPATVAKLEPGKVDKKEVWRNMGQPSEVTPDAKEWVYRFREAENNLLGLIPVYGFNQILGGKDGAVHTRHLYFDENGCYKIGNYSQEECYTSNFFSLGRTISNSFVTRDSQVRTKAEMEKLGIPYDSDKGSENQLLERALE